MDYITWNTVDPRQYERLLRAANLTVESFMPYGTYTEMRAGYRRIRHIQVLRTMMNTDLRTAKDVVDTAIRLWDNEHPHAKPDNDVVFD